ncbi:MAG: GtrA family protein [Clostridia bacterium]|nr:GtrA family protein [Clostridia bacterium]
MEKEKAQPSNAKKGILQFIKYALFAASAGLIQVISFTLLNEIVVKTPLIQNAMASSPGFARIMQNEYGPIYLIALILSVLWNFTFNRKFTFKSANNIPIAMLKVFGYYLVFTPVSVVLGNYFTAKYAAFPAIEYIVLGITMVINMVTEFLFQKFIVFRNSENTAVTKKTEEA